ncbi:MAG TPA: hypothetical protein VEA44_11095 [Caulobacter sp.]|nr:hypothetical protein [Caulobacter sp.]
MDNHLNAFDTPLEVQAVEGEIVITGPDGLSASLTVEAAIASAKRLLEAAGQGETDAG